MSKPFVAIAMGPDSYLPVMEASFGVPMNSSLDGLDALLSTVQMPAGIPLAWVAIGKAEAIRVKDAVLQMSLRS